MHDACHLGAVELAPGGERQHHRGAGLLLLAEEAVLVRQREVHARRLHRRKGGDAASELAFEAALDIDPDLTVFVLAATPMEAAARDLKCRFANEIYADRAYNPDATLVDRRQPGAVIHDPDTAAWRMVEMVASGGILTATGHRIATRIDTICLHGDGPQAVAMARAVRTALSEASVRIAAPGAH